jgi:hypothetical protein
VASVELIELTPFLKERCRHRLTPTTARCFPSVAEVQKATRYSRAAVFKALASLKAVGVLTRHQRLARVADSLGRVFSRQTSNLYTFHELAERTYLPSLLLARGRFGQR